MVLSIKFVISRQCPLNSSIQNGASTKSVLSRRCPPNPSIQDGAPTKSVLSRRCPCSQFAHSRQRLFPIKSIHSKNGEPFFLRAKQRSIFIFVVKFYSNFTTKRGSCRHPIFALQFTLLFPFLAKFKKNNKKIKNCKKHKKIRKIRKFQKKIRKSKKSKKSFSLVFGNWFNRSL